MGPDPEPPNDAAAAGAGAKTVDGHVGYVLLFYKYQDHLVFWYSWLDYPTLLA